MKTRQHRLRLIGPARTQSQLRVMGVSGSAASAKMPAAPHQGGTEPSAPKAKAATTKKTATKKTTAKKSVSRSSSGLSAETQQEIQDLLLAWLQGGDIRLAIETIAEQIYIELQQEGSQSLSMPGSYQRLGGF